MTEPSYETNLEVTEELREAVRTEAMQLITRLNQVEIEDFNLKKVEESLRGKMIWINTLTVPISLVLLLLFTLVGKLISGYIIISFIVSALIVFLLGKMFENYDHEVKWNARREVERRIAETEGDDGLIIHFKNFLPTRYRYLVQSLRRGQYLFIDQYIQAVHLLQHKLETEKFIRAWSLAHGIEDKPEEDETQESKK
jgi:hypothetical protein